MTILETAVELYKKIMAAKPKHDPMYLNFQQFVTQHFGHAGTRAMADVDESKIVFEYKQHNERRPLQAFRHPLNTAQKQEQPQIQILKSDPIRKNISTPDDSVILQPADESVLQPKFQKSEVLTQKSESLGKSVDRSTSQKNPDVADDSVDQQQTASTDKTVAIDLDDFRTLRANAIGKKYGGEVIKDWLKANDIKLTGKESVTQLAGIMIQSVKSQNDPK